MKMKEMFKKVEGYNEVAEIMHTEKAHIWFADVLTAGVTDGARFTDYNQFKKHVRKEYFADAVDFILNSETWLINGTNEFTNNSGRVLTFEVYIEED